jgi:hypothetical protein
MLLRAWGVTGADVEHAVYRAQIGPGSASREFGQVERLGGLPCPIDVRDPAAIASDQGYHWAYAIYREAP